MSATLDPSLATASQPTEEQTERSHTASDAAMERGDFAAAERHYLGAFNRNPHDVLVHLKRGQALLQLGRVAEARNDVDRALQIVPDLTEARRLMGQLCRSLHLYDESASAYGHLVEDEPNNPAAWLGFAEALALSYSRFDEAPQAFARAASLGSEDPEFLLEVADRNLVNGRFAEAEELLNGVFATHPEVREKPMPNIWLGRALEAQGRPQEARQSYEIALARYRHLANKSQSPNAIINATLYAYVLYQLGDVQQAEQVIENFCTDELPPTAFRYDHDAYLPKRLIPLHPVTQYEGATQLSVGERVVGRESALCLGLSRVAPLRA